MTEPSELWPPFGLTVRSGDLTLSAITDDDLTGLVDLVRSGIHEPDLMPFVYPWTRVAPGLVRARRHEAGTGVEPPTSETHEKRHGRANDARRRSAAVRARPERLATYIPSRVIMVGASLSADACPKTTS